MTRILNLYAGLGGNRELWTDCRVTAVEMDPDIAEVYARRFQEDKVVVGDAHAYLEDHFSEFDFIWSSPPCPSHGQYRHNVGVVAKGYKPLIPDMRLYGEIIFLSTYAMCGYAVENTVPYYEPLVKPSGLVGRHLFWTNFPLPEVVVGASGIRSKNRISDFPIGALVSGSGIGNKRQALRNCVDPGIGLAVLEAFRREKP